MNDLKFTIDVSKLKEMGYIFQKLYGRNYKSYRKKIGNRTIWLWVKGKDIEVDDWYGNTKAILDFYKANRNNPLFDTLSALDKKPRGYIKVQMNPENGHVQFFDQEEYFKVFDIKPISKAWDKWEEKYGNWHNEILLFKKDMDAILKEIKILIK